MTKTHSLEPTQFQAVGRLFGVLSDPSRLTILHLLKAGPANVSELVERTGLKQANVSKQLGLMYDVGLLSREREGNQVYYAIREVLIFQLCDLVCQKLQRDAQSQMELHQALAAAPAGRR